MSVKLKRMILIVIVISFLCSIVTYLHLESSFAATKKIHVKKATISIVAGKSYKQKLLNKQSKVIKATKVKWKSNNTSVATISKQGVVTANRTGTAKMTATYKGKKYAFTVKVKAPFEEGEQPEILTLKCDSDYSFYIKWSDVKNATGYQLAVSINGGSYETTNYGSNVHLVSFRDFVEGAEYSFKVRAKAGKMYSDYSFGTLTAPKKQNTSLVIEPSELSIKVGETRTLSVITDKGYGVTYQRDNGNISCSWGDWIGGKTATLNVTGVQVGKTVVTVYDTKNPDLKDTITINVTPEVNIKLPSLPITCSDKMSSGKLFSTVIINKAELEYKKGNDGKYNVTILFSGEKTYGSGSGAFLVKIADSEGYIVDSSMVVTEDVAVGEKFKTDWSFYSLSPGEYNLVITDHVY